MAEIWASLWATLGPAFAYGAAFVAIAFVVILWPLSLAVRDSSIVDIFWGPGCAAVGWTAWLALPSGASTGTRATLALALATAWGLRLGLYIGVRNWGAEDRRYARLRRHIEDEGRSYGWYSLRAVFLFQGAAMLVCTLPLVVAIATPALDRSGPLAWIGAAVAAAGIFIEALADRQMSVFRASRDEPGAVMNRGLWRYSRHPNYFGEMLVQWGLFAIACDAGWISLLALPGPLLLSYLIVGPMGANLLERRLRKKNSGYDEYIARTSAFVPWPPRRA